jgi:hypothetical protein
LNVLRKKDVTTLRWWIGGLLLMTALGCADQAQYGGSYNPEHDAMESARNEAVINYSCPKMRADPQPTRAREDDPEHGVFSEYLVKVRGCGITAVYKVSCRRGVLCEVEE